MGVVDFILNLAGLLLWLNWRSLRFDPVGKRKPATLIGTLRRAEPQRLQHWHLLAAIGALLLVRALFYWQIGLMSKPVWSGTLNVGIVTPSFLSNSFGRMCLFSAFSFGLTLAVFYLWLLLLSILAGPQPTHGLVRIQLGAVDRWPRWLKFSLPLVTGTLVWGLLSWPFPWMHPKPTMSAVQHAEEALLVGLGTYLTWKYVIGTLLVLHLLNSFIYFGKHPAWNYVNTTAQTLLRPIRRLGSAVTRAVFSRWSRNARWRAGEMNLSPPWKLAGALLLDVAGIALVFFLAGLAERVLVLVYVGLPF